MRIVKDVETRKNEILDASEELFTLKGYDYTSTEEIISKVGIARGTLYYHFKSKEDIMNALIDRYSNELINNAKNVANDKSIRVVERLIKTIMALNVSGRMGTEIMEVIHRPQNALMQQKVLKVIIASVTPILNQVVLDGLNEGVFKIENPYETTEMLVCYSHIAFDGDTIMMDENAKIQRMVAFIRNVEILLGMEKNALASMMKVF